MTPSFKLGGFFSPVSELKSLPPKDYPVFLDWGDNLPNMTAITVVHTPEGFVVGTDGLRQDTLGPNRDSQKLFCFKSDGVCLGYAWCGHTMVRDDNNPDTTFFDFISATEPILRQVCSANYVDWAGFIHIFRALLQIKVNNSTAQGIDWVADFNCKNIARMLLAGYVKGQSVLVEIKVEQINFKPCVSAGWLQLPESLIPFSGCNDVEMDNGLDRRPKNPEDAQSLIHEYMKRCVDNPNCKGLYGGTILVARITADAFTWMGGPEQ